MAEQPNGGVRYHVSLSEVFIRTMKRLQRQAARQGRGDQLLAAFQIIGEQLQYDPLRLGEPLFRLPALRVQVRSVAVRPLHITFGVCEDRPIVFISAAKLLAARSADDS